jgi:hypothetical protein
MQTSVRTTIRIKKDLLDQSRLLALRTGSSLQDVINQALALGYKHITDLGTTKQAMKEIDTFRHNMMKKNIKLNSLLEANQADQK